MTGKNIDREVLDILGVANTNTNIELFRDLVVQIHIGTPTLELAAGVGPLMQTNNRIRYIISPVGIEIGAGLEGAVIIVRIIILRIIACRVGIGVTQDILVTLRRE